MKELTKQEIVQVSGGFSFFGLVGGGAMAFVGAAVTTKLVSAGGPIQISLPAAQMLTVSPQAVVAASAIGLFVIGYNLASSN